MWRQGTRRVVGFEIGFPLETGLDTTCWFRSSPLALDSPWSRLVSRVIV